MRFAILGPLEVHDGDRPIPVGGAKLQTLLSALLLRANRLVPAEELADALWAERPPARAAAGLHNHVTRLRKLLGTAGPAGAARLDGVHGGYRLHVAEGELDLDGFTAALHRARRALHAEDWPEVDARTGAALALWRGTPLGGVSPEALRPDFLHLTQSHVDLLEWHFTAALHLDRHDGAAAPLAALVEQHPLNETLAVLLMRALHRTGRRAEALDVFRRMRRTLAEELGIAPGRPARAAQAEILGDTGADAPGRSRAVRTAVVSPTVVGAALAGSASVGAATVGPAAVGTAVVRTDRRPPGRTIAMASPVRAVRPVSVPRPVPPRLGWVDVPAFDGRGAAHEIRPCRDCPVWHAVVVRTGRSLLVREWHAEDCPHLAVPAARGVRCL